MLVSVIVPTLNDQAHLPVTLRQLAEQPDLELIVVDGGSDDLSAEIAQQATPYVFVSHRNLAQRLNEGARHATGDILLFLSPGSFLLPGALLELQRRLIAASAVGGAFDLHLDSPRRLFRLLERFYNRRARSAQRLRLEQGLFVWRQVFQKVGGFPDVPFGETAVLARRLRRAGRLTFIREGLVASAHRWNHFGPLRTALVDAVLGTLAALGLPTSLLGCLHDLWLRPRAGGPAPARPVHPQKEPTQNRVD